VVENIVRFESHTVIQDPSAESSNVWRICQATAGGCTAAVCSAFTPACRSQYAWEPLRCTPWRKPDAAFNFLVGGRGASVIDPRRETIQA